MLGVLLRWHQPYWVCCRCITTAIVTNIFQLYGDRLLLWRKTSKFPGKNTIHKSDSSADEEASNGILTDFDMIRIRLHVVYVYIYIHNLQSQLSYIVVGRTCLPFISSFPTPHINVNFSTTAPQHMLSSSHMSCPISFPNSTLTHFTFNFPLAIFLVIHLFLLPMFSPVIPIHVPNFLRNFSSPAFPIPQANIACSIFSPV